MSEQKDLEFELTDIDSQQLGKYTYSEKYNAQRVVMVGGDAIQVEAKFPEGFMQQSPTVIEKPIIVKEIEIREVEKPIIIEREKISFIEKPVIVKEIEQVIKEVPVYIEKIVQVEVPVIVEKEKFFGIPAWLKVCIILQSVAMLGLFIVQMFK